MKITCLIFFCVLSSLLISGQTVLYNDNFDSYPLNSYIAMQNPTWWTTWSNAPGTPEDAKISNSYAHSPSKSVRADETGGSTDLILKLGNKEYGVYELKWWMYLENGKMGYYNVQHFQIPGIEYAYEVYFLPGGFGELFTGNAGPFTFSYSQGTWFEVKQIIDLDADIAKLYVQGVLVNQWPFHYRVTSTTGTKKLGCVDFFADGTATNPGKFYLDDLVYTQIGMPADPLISVTPSSLSMTVSPGESTVQVLNVANTGGTPLVFTSNIISIADATAQLRYDGDNSNAIGWGSANITVTVAARFPNAATLPNAGLYLESVDVYINQLNTPDTNLMTLKIFGMGSSGEPGMVLRSQEFTPVDTAWENIVLTNPLLITGEDIWIGYTFTQSTLNIKIPGTDAGPANPNGDFYNTGAGWMHLSATPSQARNWNIRGNLSGNHTPQWITVSPSSATVLPNATKLLNVTCSSDTLPLGNYQGSILLLTNDPIHPQVEVPVNMTVAWPACPAPADLEVDETTSSGAAISWTNAPMAEIDFGPVGHAPGEGIIITPVVGNPYFLTGLSPVTSYQVYIRRACDYGVISAWVGPVTFTTADVYTQNLSPVNDPFGSGYISNGSFFKQEPAMNVSGAVNDTLGRGFVKFDVSSMPMNAIITKATLRYFLEGQTPATNPTGNIHALMQDPATSSGPLLHTDCGNGQPVWSGSWYAPTPGWISSSLSDNGLQYLSDRFGQSWAGFGFTSVGSGLSRFTGRNDQTKKQRLIVEYHLSSSPLFSVSPSDHNFQKINAGIISLPENFKIKNEGAGTITISSVMLDGEGSNHFLLSNNAAYPKVLAAGESFDVSVSFRPGSTGLKTTSLKITESDGTEHPVPLSGTGYVSAPLILSATPVIGPFVNLSWQAPLPSGEILYDNGCAGHWITNPSLVSSAQSMLCQRITIPANGALTHISLFTKTTNPPTVWESIRICPDNGGIPDLTAPIQTFSNIQVSDGTGHWIVLSLEDSLVVNQNQDYFIVVKWVDSSLCPAIGADTNSNNYRSAYSINGGQTWIGAGMNVLMRAYMSCPVFPANPLVGYAVRRGTIPGLYPVTFNGISATAYQDLSTTATTTYYYTVSAQYATDTAQTGEVNVTTFEICPVPSELVANNIQPTSASLSWNANGTSQWELEWGLAGFQQGTGIDISGVTSNPFVLDGLSNGTAFDFYIRSNCNNVLSSWAGPFTFYTLCPVFTTPFTENFELAAFPPACWTKTSDEITWERSANVSAYGTGNASALASFYNFTQPTPFGLRTLDFDASSLAQPALSFDFAYATYGSEVDKLDVYISQNAGESWSLGISMPGGPSGVLNTGGSTSCYFIPTTNQWKTMQIAVPTNANAIRFVATSAFGNNLYLDNIKILEPATPCATPGNLMADNISVSSAVLSWSSPLSSASWELEWGPAGFLPGNGTLISGLTTPSYSLTGLTSSANYAFVVRNICSTTNYGLWSEPFVFTTQSVVPVNFSASGVIQNNQSPCFNSTNTITVGGETTPFTVNPGGNATFIAGQLIRMLPGTKVNAGGYLLGYIAPSGPWCGSAPAPAGRITQGFVSLDSTNPASGFSLYPNPTSGNFTLKQTENQPNSSVNLVIFSNRGELVHSETLTSKPEHQIRFSEVAPGLYFVRIITQDSTEIIKLVKTK